MQIEPAHFGKKSFLQRMIHHLILNASYISDLGLYHGKMGIVLFFVHYARTTGNRRYDDFAGDLLDELYAEIHAGTAIDLESGLCGIGWGIGYLLLNGFMKGNPDEVLGEVDRIIMKKDLRRMDDFSLETGLAGISCYIRMRLDLSKRFGCPLPFDEAYLSDWKRATSRERQMEEELLKIILSKNDFDPTTGIKNWKLGLSEGCGGYGLKMILK